MIETSVERFCKEKDLRLIRIHVEESDESPPPNTFLLPAQLLCQSSDLFRNVLTGSFEEAKTGILKLPDTDAVTFGHFIQWLFAGKVLLYRKWLLGDLPKQAFNIFRFGDKLLNKDLQNEAIKIMFDVGRNMPMLSLKPCIPGAYTCTLPGHPVRALMAMISAYTIAKNPNELDDITDTITEYPEFMKDMWVELRIIGMPSKYPKNVDRYLVKG